MAASEKEFQHSPTPLFRRGSTLLAAFGRRTSLNGGGGAHPHRSSAGAGASSTMRPIDPADGGDARASATGLRASHVDPMLVSRLVVQVPQLARIPPFLRERALAAFAHSSHVASQVIVTAGAPMSTCYVVASGTFAAVDEQLGQSCPVCLYTTGDVIAERALSYTAAARLQIECISDGELYGVTGKEFRRGKEGTVFQAGDSEPTAFKFLQRMSSLRDLSAIALQALSEASHRYAAETPDAVAERFGEAAQSGATLFVVKAGSLAVKLPRPRDLARTAEHRGLSIDEPDRSITLVQGDMLSPVALSWFLAAQKRAHDYQVAERRSKRERHMPHEPRAMSAGSTAAGAAADESLARAKRVRWAALPTATEYEEAGYERQALSQQAAVTAMSSILLELPVDLVAREAPAMLMEARRCIQRKVLLGVAAFRSLSAASIDVRGCEAPRSFARPHPLPGMLWLPPPPARDTVPPPRMPLPPTHPCTTALTPQLYLCTFACAHPERSLQRERRMYAAASRLRRTCSMPLWSSTSLPGL